MSQNTGMTMSAPREVYADGVETIHMFNGAVRIDLFTLQPPVDGGEPVMRVGERVIMPLPAFLGMYDTMEKIVDKLVDDGLIRRPEKEQE